MTLWMKLMASVRERPDSYTTRCLKILKQIVGRGSSDSCWKISFIMSVVNTVESAEV